MLRIIEYEEMNADMRQMLASIASKTICAAIDGMFPSMSRVVGFYTECFAGPPAGDGEMEYFRGLAACIKERSAVTETESGCPISEDGRAGLEVLSRKLFRIKEKMEDPDAYYDLDPFEELILSHVIEEYQILDKKPSPELRRRMKKTRTILRKTYGTDPDMAAYLARSVHRIEMMAAYDDLPVVLDDNRSFVLEDGFLDGIRQLAGGMGAILCWSYEEVLAIFTDIGIEAPLELVGTRQDYLDRGREAIETACRSLEYEDCEEEDFDWMDDEDLPFR